MTEKRRSLTVSELIKLLSAVDPNLPAVADGCDCEDDVGGIELVEGRHGGPYVLIKRADHMKED